ncbi:hypothetical protein GAO09_05985 [Rhizobiales bacterium RZME27]|uniref:Uncharacterized protein n=1 Tax=Endobacterium cereale TaxID=2663029 RepID=A0A6A8A485_9HYPH|nr:hypothetical protein [Endobacterium cereale]MEB2843647.1 hypothetical protein [Endobacterium cereale]MQY45609.1 hypothetical protein [Endobacterium cereale]
MDDFTQIMRMLESARQLADMNQLPLLVYLIEVAKAEGRANRFELREKKRGERIAGKGVAG